MAEIVVNWEGKEARFPAGVVGKEVVRSLAPHLAARALVMEVGGKSRICRIPSRQTARLSFSLGTMVLASGPCATARPMSWPRR